MGLVLPGAALFIYLVVQRDFSVWKRMHWLPGMAVFLLVTAPWFYLVMKANPEFFQRFFIYEHYPRFTTKEHGRYQPWHYFIPILLLGMLPWTLLMFDTLLRTWKGGARAAKAFNAERFLLIWAVFIYVFFSVSGSKLPSYLLPMFPALALLMGKQLAEMSARRLFWLVAPVLPLVLLGLGLAPFTARLADTPLQVQMYGEYAGWLVAAALVWSLGMIAALVLLRRQCIQHQAGGGVGAGVELPACRADRHFRLQHHSEGALRLLHRRCDTPLRQGGRCRSIRWPPTNRPCRST